MSEMLPLQQERKFSKKKVTSNISESQATYTPSMSKSLKTPFNNADIIEFNVFLMLSLAEGVGGVVVGKYE